MAHLAVERNSLSGGRQPPEFCLSQGADAPRSTSLLRCLDCHTPLLTPHDIGTTCDVCGRVYPIRDGLLIAQDELTGKNRIAAAFYNSERWPRFRPWEQLFLKTLGGLPGARMQILRHLRHLHGGKLLEVGIGDGENVALLPRVAGHRRHRHC